MTEGPPLEPDRPGRRVGGSRAARPNGGPKAEGGGVSCAFRRGGEPSWSGSWRGVLTIRDRPLDGDGEGPGRGELGRSSGRGKKAAKPAKKSWSNRPGQINAVLSPWAG